MAYAEGGAVLVHAVYEGDGRKVLAAGGGVKEPAHRPLLASRPFAGSRVRPRSSRRAPIEAPAGDCVRMHALQGLALDEASGWLTRSTLGCQPNGPGLSASRSFARRHVGPLSPCLTPIEAPAGPCVRLRAGAGSYGSYISAVLKRVAHERVGLQT